MSQIKRVLIAPIDRWFTRAFAYKPGTVVRTYEELMNAEFDPDFVPQVMLVKEFWTGQMDTNGRYVPMYDCLILATGEIKTFAGYEITNHGT